jgi:hypothetical protein
MSDELILRVNCWNAKFTASVDEKTGNITTSFSGTYQPLGAVWHEREVTPLTDDERKAWGAPDAK